MVTAAARPYIDASVPVLREHGLTITTTFYRNMFAAHPELSNLFNMGNQASGVQQQSLAAAVFAYAANIDNAAALAPVIARIVHKHVSIGIKPAHYPIVGRYLLGAIADTIGDAATPDLLSAWEEAYTELANLFIAAEQELYGQAGVTAGTLRDMRVVKVERQSANVTSYTLQAVNEQTVPSFTPGQYISVAVDFADGRRQIRQYSLSDAPNSESLRISVKRESARQDTPQGEVSNWLHQHVSIGSVLQVSHPFGEFVPDTESIEPIVMLSAGVGITPMIAALNRIAQVQPQRHMIFAHAVTNKEHHSHLADVRAAMEVMPNLQVVNFYETLTDDAHTDINAAAHAGWMDIAKLPKWPRTETKVYLCGPAGFMKAQWLALLTAGVPVSHLHKEVFGPDLLDSLV
ncbi:NO-inducible flavohemoprotein [soil metagenome]